VEARLHPFLGGILRDLRCHPIAIDGWREHVHLLFRFPSDVAIADVVRHVKSRSTGWLRAEMPGMREFAWQKGCGGFTVSTSRVETVRRYVESQKERHRGEAFEVEFVRLLRAHGFDVSGDDVFE
jgi:REP element-mobilizing transposase RayT